MSKHILLTTMSTFPPNYRSPSGNRGVAVPNYYTVSIGDDSFYCNGILQTEAGSKYFLHTTSQIDEIIAIVSPETVYDLESADGHIPDQEYINNVAEFVPVADDWIKNSTCSDPLSPYGYYAYRIGQFLRQVDKQTDDLMLSIDDERKAALKNITDKILKNANLKSEGLWFHAVNSSSANKTGTPLFTIIRQALKEDIEKDYIKEEDYSRYKGSVDDCLSKFEIESTLTGLKNQIAVRESDLNKLRQNIKDLHEDVAKSRSIKSFAKEIWFKIIQKTLEHSVANLEKEATQEKADVYIKLIEVLKSAIESLIKELQDLKTNRLRSEENYIKSYLYKKLDGKYRLAPVSSNQEVSLRYVKDKMPIKGTAGSDTESVPNITGIVNAICPEGTSEDIYLYIDMQGGSRTQGYVLNAVLTILNNETTNNVKIEKIVTTKFESRKFTNEITDDTKRYKIIDLASGMNAFLQYGRSDQIRSYFDTVYGEANTPEQLKKLLTEMQHVDQALSICDIQSLEDSIKKIHELFNTDYEVTDEFSGIFKTMIDEIGHDYRGLLYKDADNENSWKIDYYALANWAYQKHFIQQAITIIESKMPTVFVEEGLLYYCRKSDEVLKNSVVDILADELIKNQGTDLSILWNTNTHFSWKFDDINHYIIKNYHPNIIPERETAGMKKRTKKYYGGDYNKTAWRNTAIILKMLKNAEPGCIKFFSDIDISIQLNLLLLAELIFLYYYISKIRNEINHSVDGQRISYEVIAGLTENFLNIFGQLVEYPNFTNSHSAEQICFEEVRDKAIEKHNNEVSTTAVHTS